MRAVIVTCAVFALGAVTAEAAVLTDTNFNSTSTGSTPSTYTVSESGGTVRVAGTPSSSNRSVFLNDTSTTTLVSAKKTFPAQSGVVDAEFKFMQTTLVNNAKVFRLLSGTTAAISIETIGGALQYRGPNSVYTSLLGGYVANRWYSLRIVANPATDTADVYVNGVRKITAAFFGPVTSIDGFDSFTPNTSTGSHYLDDVVIKSVSTAIPSGAVVVDFNGTGNYMTVGAAIAAIPANNTAPRVIYVKNGTYNERLNFPADKQNITLIGQSATGTVLSCNDTSASAGGTTNSSCTFVRGNGFTAKNITFRNNAGQTAGQAVALYVSGDRDAFYNVRVLGWQDTLYANGSGRQYYRDSYIEGHVDFIFGSGTAVFESCEIRSLVPGVAITAASTDQANPWGYVFINSSLTRAGTLDDTTDLGRPWRPYSSVTYLYSWMDTHIRPAGWNNWSDTANEATARYSEFGNTGPGSSTSARVSWSHVLSSSQAAAINAQSVLARTDGWNPAALDP
jgi:pectinesterase